MTPKPKPQGRPSKLSAKEDKFVRFYLVDLNASNAYRKAGYAPKNADVNAAKLMVKDSIRNAIQYHMDKRAKRLEITQDRVLTEIAHSAFLDPISLFTETGALLPLSEMPEEARRAIAGLEVEEIFEGTGKDRKWIGYLKKIKFVSKEGTLTLAGRHLKMFTDKTELSLTEGLADSVKKARERIGSDKKPT